MARQEIERKLFGFVIFADDGQGLPIIFRPDSGTVRLGDGEAPFAVTDLTEGEDLELRIFVDHYLVEVFVNDRQALVAVYPDYADRRTLAAFSVGQPTQIESITMWKLTPTHGGFGEARERPVWIPDEA